uniref:Hydroxyacylglutathione hydrolase like n=1 Tax=Junco hyemalis TaxID=40217 RepID=A0A8C5IPH7_JUNHY
MWPHRFQGAHPNPSLSGVVLEAPTLSWVPNAIRADAAGPTQSLIRSVACWAPGRRGEVWGSVCPPQEDPDPLSPQFGTIRVRCLFTPCHTSGHMCYFMWEDDSPDAPALFSGDTLFVGGCGQFFEGTAEQMHTNLTQILGTLPKDTKVFCGHECTVRNLKFALKVEPENEVVKEKLAWAKQRDDEDLPTVPSTLQEEFLYNPFLRVTEEAVQRFTGRTEPVEVLRALRSHRDTFKKPKERPNPQAMLAFDWGLFGPFLEKK